MTSGATGPTRRSRTSLDRDVDERASRRRRERMFRRCFRVYVSEADALVWLFGMLSLIYCSITVVVEVIGLLAG